MSDITDFSALVGDIYDAALDASLWPSVLQKISGFVPGRYANIFIQDANNRFANSIFTWGVDPAYFQSYLQTYAKLNPCFPGGFFFDVGEVFSVYDILPRDQFERTRFCREWVVPQGIGDSPGAILEKSPTSCALLTVTQPPIQTPPYEDIRSRLQLIVPHVRRAVLIGKAFDLQKAVAADFTATVAALAASVCLIDAPGRVVYANPSAMKLLETDDVLYGASRRLRAYDRAADQSLNELLTACADGNDLAIGAGGGAIHLPSRGGRNYVAHVLPLTSGARRDAGVPHRAVAALVVHNAAENLSSPPEVIAKAYGLTPREVGVLFALVEAPGVAEMAEILGLSSATVRTHLRSLFAKTGTTRQAELVKLVASFMSPVV